MEKLTFNQLKNESWKEAVIVFTKGSFNREFTEESRSYRVKSDAKYFDANMIGNSLFGDCLDGKDDAVRLDRYMYHQKEGENWEVEYCYIIK